LALQHYRYDLLLLAAASSQQGAETSKPAALLLAQAVATPQQMLDRSTPVLLPSMPDVQCDAEAAQHQ
jgi:hypothetical protein